MPDLHPAAEIVDKLEDLRFRCARVEATRHEVRVEAFTTSPSSTIKEREMAGEVATLGLNRDILMMRAEIRTLEDRLQVELHAFQP